MLRAACSGELVPTEAELARAEGREYEPACVLLERILAERRAHWDAQEKRRGKYKEPAAPDTSDLPSLSEGWTCVDLNQLVYLLEGEPLSPPRITNLAGECCDPARSGTDSLICTIFVICRTVQLKDPTHISSAETCFSQG